jgi:hypothetical protein
MPRIFAIGQRDGSEADYSERLWALRNHDTPTARAAYRALRVEAATAHPTFAGSHWDWPAAANETPAPSPSKAAHQSEERMKQARAEKARREREAKERTRQFKSEKKTMTMRSEKDSKEPEMSEEEALALLKQAYADEKDPAKKARYGKVLRALGVDPEEGEKEAAALARMGAAAFTSRDLGCEIDFGSGDRAQAARYIGALDKVRGTR